MLRYILYPLCLIFTLALLWGGAAFAKRTETVVTIERLEPLMQVHDEDSRNWMPLVAFKDNRDFKTIGFSISKSQAYYLRFYAEKGTCLYVNSKLYKYCSVADTQVIKLLPILNREGLDKVFCTVYNPGGRFNFSSYEIVNKVSVDSLATVKTSNGAGTDILRRGIYDNDLFNLVLLVTAILYVTAKVYSPRSFKYLLSFADLLRTDPEIYNDANRKVYSVFGVTVSIANAISIATALFIANRFVAFDKGLLPSFLFASGSATTSVLLANFVLVGVLYIGVKLFMISSFAGLFGLDEFRGSHSFEFFRITTLIGLGAFLMVLVSYVGNSIESVFMVKVIQYIIIVLLSIRAIKMLWVLRGGSKLNSLFLFSYLCLTEVVPMIFVAKLIIV